MATSTTKLGLTKPDYTDVVDVADLNTNADLIDSAAGFTICTSSTRPGSPWSGQVIYETDTGLSLVWDGSAWQPAGGGGGGVTISSTAPASPSAGDLWWDSDDGEMYLYYDDGSSQQWVSAAGPSVAVQSTAPTGYEGQLWLDDTDGSMYVYYTDPGGGSSSWIGAVSRSGGILQVVSTTKTDTFSTTSGSFTDITGLSASITPRSTSSKIMVTVTMSCGYSVDTCRTAFRLLRDATAVGVGDASGSQLQANTGGNPGAVSDTDTARQKDSVSFSFLDSPSSTSSLDYQVQVDVSTGTMYLNRSSDEASASDDPRFARTASTITLMEVAG